MWGIRTGMAVLVMGGTAILLLAGCGDAEAREESAVRVDTLSGGAVRVRNEAEGLWEEGSGWSLAEDLRLGSVEGDSPELFGSIAAFEIDDAGRIYVLDRDVPEVRVFGPDGRHLRSFGRAGEGPGELKRPYGLEIGPRGRVWVVDLGNQRYSIFDTAGILVDDVRRFAGGNVVPWPGEMLDDGRVVEVDFRFVDGESVRTYTVHQPDGAVLDTVAMPAPRTPEFVHRTESSIVSADVPFTPSLHRVLAGDGALWLGLSDRYRIVRTDLLSGDTLHIVERAYEPVPVTAAEKDAAVQRLDWFSRQGGDVDRSRIPEEHPAFSGFLVDRRGYLWVRPITPRAGEVTAETLYAPRPGTFDVFDEAGRYLGRVETDVPLYRPKVTEKHLYGVTVDDLGVQYLVRMRIEGR